MLSQLGNISSLFRHRDKSQVETIGVQILGMIDEEKTNALLWKMQTSYTSGTQTSEIVRKRSIKISLDNASHSVSFLSRVNLAKSTEDIYEPEILTKSWDLPLLTGTWYECSGSNKGIKLQNGSSDINTVQMEFIGDSIKFSFEKGTEFEPLNSLRLVLKLTSNTAHQEVHIDRRTWLTFTRVSSPLPDTIFCN